MSAPADSPEPLATEATPAEVDGSLIDMLLALTPEERLRWNDAVVGSIQELRDAVREAQAASRKP